MNKIELKILGISYSQSQIGSYVAVLGATNNKKIPLIIKPAEAQRIAVELEGIKSPRPLTHDLIKSLSDAYQIDVQEVYIHQLLEGVFYTKLITSNGFDNIEIECTAGDGIALSIIYGCPLYTTSEILNSVGIAINDDGTFSSGDDVDNSDTADEDEPEKKTEYMSTEDLEIMMEKAISNEEYEIAAKLRDKIDERREQ